MTKKEIYTELIFLGYVKESIEGLLKSELKSLLDAHTARETEDFINAPEPDDFGPAIRITNKFATELWLCGGIRVFKKNDAKLFASVGVNDFLRKVGDKWETLH